MKPYRLADAAMRQLSGYIITVAGEAKQSILRFDEINSLKAVDTLYRKIDRRVRRVLKKLCRDRFLEMLLFLAAVGDVDAEKMVKELLGTPNEILHYSYDTEIIRKRERLKEALLTLPTKTQRQLEVEKAMRQLNQMIGWYTDIASQEAEYAALKTAGVKKVRWNIYGDDRVCATCEGMDGKVYEIDKVPDRPHPKCRCYLTKAD